MEKDLGTFDVVVAVSITERGDVDKESSFERLAAGVEDLEGVDVGSVACSDVLVTLHT